ERPDEPAPPAETLVVPDQQEHGVPRRRVAPEAHEEVEALAPEPGADGGAYAHVVREPELAPEATPEVVAMPGMEAHQIDAVVDDRDALAADAVVARDLVGDARRDREYPAVPGGRERGALEPE